MEFLDVVRRRKMVRSFTDEPVDPDVVRRVLDVARRGPSAGYSQGVEFVVVTDPATRAAIAEPGREMFEQLQRPDFVAQAQVHVVICVSPEIYKGRYREADKQQVVSEIDEDALWVVPFWYTDAGAAMTLLLLAAVDEGIGAAFVGGLEADDVRTLLGIPAEYIPVGIALLGHEAPDAKTWGDVAAAGRRPRRRYDEVVHQERW
ncbi:nitroreductase family protein [Kribbella sp. NPDC051770]|uniref:nitroreductase family protein n=1 Tax=Kribbella sp. NPDC051770 TaxID=3155413 RepID=UPI00341225EE